MYEANEPVSLGISSGHIPSDLIHFTFGKNVTALLQQSAVAKLVN